MTKIAVAKDEGGEISRTQTTTLEIQHSGEDGSPLAVTLENGVTLLSVTDGLGGAGGVWIYHKNIGSDVLIRASMAKVAADNAQEVVGEFIEDVGSVPPPSASTESLAKALSERLIQRFNTLPDQWTFRDGIPISDYENLGRILTPTPFPTTIATAMIQEVSDERDVPLNLIRVFWAGDSPIAILTPTSLYTTLSSEDAKNDVIVEPTIFLQPDIYEDEIPLSLRWAEIALPANSPYLICVASDGLTSYNSAGAFTINRPVAFRWFLADLAEKCTAGADLQATLKEIVDSLHVSRVKESDLGMFLYPDDITVAIHTNNLAQFSVPSNLGELDIVILRHQDSIRSSV